MNDFKLGKLEKRVDTRTLQFANYLTPALPAPPPSIDYSKIGQPFGMFGNDQAGDCVFASQGHADQMWVWHGLHSNLAITAAQVLAAYSAVTGYIPGRPETDRGSTMLDGLKYWRKTGIAGEMIEAFVEIQPTRIDQVKLAIDLFGCIYVGVALPNNVLPVGGIPPWTKTDQPAQPSNGHAVSIVGYDASALLVVTWAHIIVASWAFFMKYCDEAYVALSPSWAVDAPPGFDLSTLRADLQLITGNAPTPTPTPVPVPVPPAPEPVPPFPPPNPAPLVLGRSLHLATPHLKGADVRLLQQRLMGNGIVLPKYGADGDFGNETKTGVLAFQRRTWPNDPLAWTGVVDPAWDLLRG